MPEIPAGDPARNLLFGLLAFQNQFISRRALLSAFDDWRFDRSRSLGRILIDQGELSEDLHALVEGLVGAHLALHGNDPEKSLATLTPIGPVRRDLASLADAAMQATLSHVSSERDDEDDPYATDTASVGASTSSGVRFKILRPLDSGGMGVVSVALDTELDRPIALKEIRGSSADDREYRARFLAEAEITGKLEHPGIIPIYGLGTYADGRPFYAMRLIRGEKTGSLMDAIKAFHKDPDRGSRVVEFRGLLGRFLDVCNAVSYAHSRGVLHRDLKPHNILLGPYGETLVVDWGLARAAGRTDPGSLPGVADADHVRLNLSGSELSPTMAGGPLGTPAYAPPEQMTGDLDNIGPRSDVYGLGAVLYCLMTGRPPFSRDGLDLAQLIKKIEAGDFPPPRQIRADLDRSLEAICLKSLSTRPADRYGSVKELAGDVERYLADEPVTAYREPRAVRARRWTRKHRTAVTAAAAALLVGVLGLAAIAVIQTRARNDLAVKTVALDKQRRRAEEREAQAIAAVKRFGDVVRETPELKTNPALDALRKLLLKEPLVFFRDLREGLLADRDTRPESLGRLADASLELGQLTYELGDRQDALAAYQESLAIHRKLANADPTSAVHQSHLAISYQNIAVMMRTMGKLDEALHACELAIGIRKRLAEAGSADDQSRADLAQSYHNLGNLQGDLGKPAEAMKAYEAAMAIQQKLADGREGISFLSDLARSQYNLSSLLNDMGKPAEALQVSQAALMTRQKVAHAEPTAIEFQTDVADSHNLIGVLQKTAGNLPEAMKAYEAASAIQQKLAEANPSVNKYQHALGTSHYNMGLLLWSSKKPAEALKAYDLSLKIRQKLADANPAVTQYQVDLASTHNNKANPLWVAERRAEAVKEFEAATAILQKLAEAHPDSHEFASLFAASLSNLAATDLEAKQFEKGRDRLLKAAGLQRKALAAYPNHWAYRRYLTDNLNNLIEAAQGLGDARGEAEARRELATLQESDPAFVALKARLSAVLKGEQPPKDRQERLVLAQRAYDMGLYAGAARLWAVALADDPKLGEDREAQVRYNASCAASLAGSGQGADDPRPDEAARANLRGQALEWLGAELQLWKKLSEPDGPGGKQLVAANLSHWKQDADLAGVRDAASLETLPEPERKAWQDLWAEVDGLLAEVSKP